MTERRPAAVLPSSVVLPSFWHRHRFAVVMACLLVLGVGYERLARHTLATDDHSRYHDRSFRVAYVIDGDTLDIEVSDGEEATTRVRLLGVDAAELGRVSGTDMYFARQAASFAREMLADRDVHIVLPEERTRGKYGRLLAYVFLERGGVLFNEVLVEEGYAYADLRFEHHYMDRFKAAEKRARRARAGLWADVTVEQMPKWKQRFEQERASRSQQP